MRHPRPTIPSVPLAPVLTAVLTVVLTAALTAALALPAAAGDVRPPNNAAGSGGATGGSISLPGTADIDAPPIRTTMEEKRKREDRKAVSDDMVQQLRQMAIESGQSSGSGDAKE